MRQVRDKDLPRYADLRCSDTDAAASSAGELHGRHQGCQIPSSPRGTRGVQDRGPVERDIDHHGSDRPNRDAGVTKRLAQNRHMLTVQTVRRPISLLCVSVLAGLLNVSGAVSAENLVDPGNNAVEEALAEVAATQSSVMDASLELGRARAAVIAAEQAVGSARSTTARNGVELARVSSDGRQAAVSSYVAGGGISHGASSILDAAPGEIIKANTILEVVIDRKHQSILLAREAWEAATDNVRVASQQLGFAEMRVRRAEQRLEAARVVAMGAIEHLTRAQNEHRAAQAGTALSDIPAVALQAYSKAAAWAAESTGCDVAWWAIAAVGRHESRHGNYLAVLNNDGSVTPEIIGIALDGSRSLAIRDTDNGVLDDDDVWDRAVGPMQVIPSTWRWYSSMFDLDGDANGVEDPQNIFDGARLTATMMCRNSAALGTEAGLRRAYWAYNPSQSYNDRVLASAMEYAKLDAP